MRIPPENDDGREARPRPTVVARAVTVNYEPHGAWEIAVPDYGPPLVCETLEEAQRIAYLCAVQRSPCELTVHDAYHRLILRRVIDADDRSGACLSSPALARRRPRQRSSPTAALELMRGDATE